jgi:hypothetical protein
MSAPVRFLVLAVASWIGLRVYLLDGDFAYSAAAVDLRPPPPSSPIAALAPDSPEPPPGWIDAVAEAQLPAGQPAAPPALSPAAAQFPAGAARVVMVRLAAPRPIYSPVPDYSGMPQAEDYPLSRLASAAPRSAPLAAGDSKPFQSTQASFAASALQPFDRLSLTGWSMMRQSMPAPLSLGNSGMLGGSQAGARLTWAYNRSLAATLRVSAPINQQKLAGEAALGVAWKPFRAIPARIVAERRQALGTGAGGSAFALFAEGGVYQRPLPFGLKLDGYAQAGVVGIRDRALFAEGSLAATRPLSGKISRFSAGIGVWGGFQPGLSRLDVGPRLTMQWGRSTRIHLDYRLKVAGNALPGSGPAVTVAGDF